MVSSVQWHGIVAEYSGVVFIGRQRADKLHRRRIPSKLPILSIAVVVLSGDCAVSRVEDTRTCVVVSVFVQVLSGTRRTCPRRGTVSGSSGGIVAVLSSLESVFSLLNSVTQT